MNHVAADEPKLINDAWAGMEWSGAAVATATAKSDGVTLPNPIFRKPRQKSLGPS